MTSPDEPPAESPAESPAEPLSRFGAWLRAERGASPHTQRAYLTELRGLAESVAPAGGGQRARSLLDLTTLDLRGWLAKSAPDQAPATIARRIASLKTFYRWALREALIRESPAERLQAPRVRRPLPRVLEIGEASALVEAPVGEGWRGARNAALLEVAYGAGLRVSELAGLDLRDVDAPGGMVRVRAGKGRKDRLTPLGAPAIAAIQHWLSHRGSAEGPLFLNPEGARLGVRGIYDVVRQSGVKNGMTGVHPHALRHSYATHLLSQGADIRSIQEMMGHESLSTTQRYAQVDLELLRKTWLNAHPHGRR